MKVTKLNEDVVYSCCLIDASFD